MYTKSGFFEGPTREQLEVSRKLLQDATDPKKAIEIARDKNLLSQVATNPFGIKALICAHGHNPEFAKALLDNPEFLKDVGSTFYQVLVRTCIKEDLGDIELTTPYNRPNPFGSRL